MRSFSQKEYFFGLLLASLILWLIGLGNLPLRDWDEGTYAIVAREIYRTGNWLYPTIQGDPFLLKPPLMQWLIAICYHIGGVQEFTTRFPGAFLTALGVPLLYLIGCLAFRENLPALCSALVYLTLLPVVRHGRLAMLDGMTISFFLLLLFCVLKARHDKKYALGIGFCLGLITLTKGMLVVVLAGIAGLFILANKQLALLKNPFLWIGMLLGNFPAIAWYFAQWQHYGNIFLEVHFQSQAFDRLGKAVEGNTGPVWYYLLEVIKYGFPWLLFLPGGLYLSWKNRDTAWGCLTLIGTIVYFAIVSLMGTKLPWYIMPVYPFLALAIGANLSYIWQGGKFRSKFLTGFLGFLIIVGLAGCVYFIMFDKQPLLIVMSIILAITMVITSWLINQHNRQFISVLLTGMYLVLALLMSSQSWIWELNEKFPVVPVATLIKDNVPPGTQIYTSFPDSRPSLDFYSDCKIIPASIADLQDKFVHKSYLLVDNENLQKMNLKQSKIIGEAKGFNLITTN
ncbi:Undecaprenyl phosphate-alpha-4-amino-4-deoxy-L-arabinose arabinosyl transferase [Dolichospermum sp. UHCC 0315A]|uniref:ArnT family glycosyltransferase n=1 Tax=Dolichospermum sp. UHCC 0315A TaxID=1914871 RepID=UPI0011E6CAE5|nr:glycosyltransferase family 39 protein [Dolichospermum sp. UHCC 0315A]QEI42100.1 Undecaprenyl phosphate-alpha-4-amino-4-deoxy-L-arabinose arabinosyl transferase [Dolichospermum sp. UHCC 0315A]